MGQELERLRQVLGRRGQLAVGAVQVVPHMKGAVVLVQGSFLVFRRELRVPEHVAVVLIRLDVSLAGILYGPGLRLLMLVFCLWARVVNWRPLCLALSARSLGAFLSLLQAPLSVWAYPSPASAVQVEDPY